jgi:hypothetical protein
MDNNKFVYNQVRFMYGKYHDYLTYNMSNLINIDESFNIEDVSNNNHRMNDPRNLDFNIFFYQIINKYYNKDLKSTIFNVDWYDNKDYDKFIFTHNRKFNIYNQIIFPIKGYHFPLDINFNDTINFYNKNNKLFWRGSSTGSANINENKRYQIISKNFNIHPDFDIGFSNLVQNNTDFFHPFYKSYIEKFDQVNNKFILCIEGNDWASNFPWVLASNCCPIHNYPFESVSYLFGQGLEPYVHFIPINCDGSDLLDKYNWCLNNIDKCNEIANNGKIYMESYMSEYLFDQVMNEFFRLYPAH